MKIMLIADVHNNPEVEKEKHDPSIEKLKKIIDTVPADLIVFLGDTVYGPAVKKDFALYRKFSREVYDCTKSVPFATVFGNHDDEDSISKDEILSIIAEYPNALTNGRNYVLKIDGETLLFIDSGSYYEGEGSCYDTVKPGIIEWAKGEISGTKAILFQHIIVPDILSLVTGEAFNDGVEYTGEIKESPCPPDINTGELRELSPYLKAAVFGHDHENSFEVELMGVKLIQCAGAGLQSYEYPQPPSVKILDTKTLETRRIPI
ncbi:MAG: metallophosphoesterase [Eubacterium sp.]|nr:metallophosphoesterase [Eubacterium sp.]